MIPSLIQFALHLVQIPNFAINKTPSYRDRTSSMLYSLCDMWGFSSFTNSLPHIYPPTGPKNFELWFISQKDSIPLLNSSVFLWLGLLEPSNIVLFPQHFCHISQLLCTVDVDIFFFMTLVQLYRDVWSSQPSFTQAGHSDEIVLCIGKTGSI